MQALGVFLLALFLAPAPARNLDIYFVDVEGGQATLMVTPSGESLLVDTGWPDFNGRDADRIAAVVKLAGLRRIDDVIITHYHGDHVGGVAQLAARIPVGTFIDHGASVEKGKEADALVAAYHEVAAKANHRVAKPGNHIPLNGVDVEVLTANGEHVETRPENAGQPNSYCASVKRQADDPSENARSVGILVTFGKFRFIDLGDLTWNKELDLVCPNNRVGTVDVYLTTHHGTGGGESESNAIVWALHPRVAIMNNGARKGGSSDAWQTVKDSPGLEDLWQLHYAIEGGQEHNVAADYIANPEEKCEGKYLKLSAQPDGSFRVINSRNSFTKMYAAKH